MHIETVSVKMKPRQIEARNQLLLNYKIWLSTLTGEGLIEESTWKLLKAIRSEDSISKAAKIAGISYRKAWGDLKKTEELLGYAIVTKKRGGQDGGSTTVTDKAVKLLEAYAALQSKLDDSVEEAFSEFRKNLKQ
jgi:molybdate transport system regulatory protein